MSETHTDSDTEKLRAFEKKMHDEGAAGFADGPSPWETWDDESGLLKNNRVWEGSSRRIYPGKRAQQSLGDRVLSGLAMLSLATMVVGIAGVYFSDPQSGQVVATGIQPLPIDRSPSATDRAVEHLAQLPAPAAGTDSFTVAPPAPRLRPAPIAVVAAPAASKDAEPPARKTEIDAAPLAAAPQEGAAHESGSGPAPAAAAPDIEPAGSAASSSTAPLAAPDRTIPTGAANTAAQPPAPAATDTANAVTGEAVVTTADTVAATADQSRIATSATLPDTVTTLAEQPTLPNSLAATAPGSVAVTAAATEPEPAVRPAVAALEADRVDAAPAADMKTLPGPAEESPVAQATGNVTADVLAEAVASPQPGPAVTEAAAVTAIAKSAPDVADTVTGPETLPVPMAGPGDTAATPAAQTPPPAPPATLDTPAGSTAAAIHAPDTVVAAADPVTSTTATPPAAAVQQLSLIHI